MSTAYSLRPYCASSSFRHKGDKVKNKGDSKALKELTVRYGITVCTCVHQNEGPCALRVGVCAWRSVCSTRPLNTCASADRAAPSPLLHYTHVERTYNIMYKVLVISFNSNSIIDFLIENSYRKLRLKKDQETCQVTQAVHGRTWVINQFPDSHPSPGGGDCWDCNPPRACTLLVHLPEPEMRLLALDFFAPCTSLSLPQTSHLNNDRLSALPKPMVLKVWSPDLQHQNHLATC